MDNRNIPMPTPEEKDRAVNAILDAALLEPGRTRFYWQWLRLSWPTLFFGVGDCLFLACLLAGLILIPAAAVAAKGISLAGLLFLLSPCLYALLQGLTTWKELMSGTLEWKMTCRVSLRALTALRMLVFGGASTMVCVPANVLLWYAGGCRVGLPWMLGLSFSSLFLYAALSLACQRLRPRWALLAAPAAWLSAGNVLLFSQKAAVLLEQVPALVFLCIALGGLSIYLAELRAYLTKPLEGGACYAVR